MSARRAASGSRLQALGRAVQAFYEETIVERMRAESQKPPKATSQKPRAKSQEPKAKSQKPRVESGPRQFVGRAFWFDSSRESGATVSMLIAASKISSSRQTEQRYSTP